MNDLRAELQAALGGAYTVERELGGGGMSHLFVARDQALGRDVVVKVVAAQGGARLSIERFRREVSLAASLQHPHIVSVLAAGEVAGLPYFLMPYVEGQSVRQRLESGPLSVPDTVAILRDVARALAYAHARGVVHRDIKPDNVLLAGGSAMINDFGIAKALASARVTPSPQTAPSAATLTQEGLALGTPGYMAPEQVAGDPNVDHRADIYAFGALAYEMLTGAGPFKDTTPHQLLAAQLTEAPRPITGMRDGLPIRLADLVMACLERHPKDRPQSAAELVRALDDPAVISGAVATRPVPLRTRRRWLMPAALTAAGATILAVGGVVLSRSGAAAPPNSVAVLPLTNAGADSAAYLADGLTDEITLALSRLPGVRVASPSAAATYRGRSLPPAEIGRALGVATLLEGSVQMSGGRLRLVARLTDARDGQTLWSQGYEGDVRDIFAVQDSIAGAIAEAFRGRIGGAGTASAARGVQGTGDVAAYDAFLRGRFLFQRRTPEALRAALTAFQEAITRDSGFARAYAGLGDVYAVLPLYTNMPAESTQALALEAVSQALAIDSTLSDARASRGYLNMLLWRWADAERDLSAATRGDSASVTAWQWYGEWLLYNGHTREGVDALTRASVLAPASGLLVALRAVALGVDRQPAEATPLAQRAVAMDTAVIALPFMQGAVLAYGGRPAEAVAPLEATRRGGLDVPPVLGLLGYALAASGQRARAVALRDSLLARAGAPGATAALAHVWLGLGDTAQALTWLEWAAGAHDALFASQSLAAPIYDPIRGSPRFAEVVRRVGLDVGRLTRGPRGSGR